MEQRDFLLREIEKISQLLTYWMSKLTGLNAVNFESGMKQLDIALITQFDLTLDKLTRIDKSELIEKIKDLDKANLELVIKLLSITIDKIDELEKDKAYKIDKLIENTLILIEYLDTETKTLSMERMHQKVKLQKILSKKH